MSEEEAVAEFNDGTKELGDKIESDLITWDIPIACEGDDSGSTGGGGSGSSADCPDGEVEDCDDVCITESWIGDGSCDDGTGGWVGNFDCYEFDFDAGDCD